MVQGANQRYAMLYWSFKLKLIDDSAQFLHQIIDARGRLERFRNMSSIEVQFQVSGATLALKNHPAELTMTAMSTQNLRTQSSRSF